MARNIPDLALFLDTMAGYCPLDPLTFDAPALSFVNAVAQARPPRRIAYTSNYGGRLAVDRETREICAAAPFRELGHVEGRPDLGAGGVHGVAVAVFVVDRELHYALIAINSSPTSSGRP
jgi:amidase